MDTNILVRALIKPRGSAGAVIGRLRDGAYLLVYSEALLRELLDVLARPRIALKYGVGPADTEALMGLLLARGEGVKPVERISACRDPADDKFLEAAVAGSADFIVSGDEDLLVLNPFRGISIVGASAFLARLGPHCE